jgi:hypothetical protein
MHATIKRSRSVGTVTGLLVGYLLVVATFAAAADINVTLTGREEVPAITSSASGSGTIKIADDRSVSGSVKTTGIAGTTAHIHNGAAGKNGPPIITLTKTADNEWSVPAGTMLTDEQFAVFKAGSLYINVHSAANPSGEIRGQLKP